MPYTSTKHNALWFWNIPRSPPIWYLGIHTFSTKVLTLFLVGHTKFKVCSCSTLFTTIYIRSNIRDVDFHINCNFFSFLFFCAYFIIKNNQQQYNIICSKEKKKKDIYIFFFFFPLVLLLTLAVLCKGQLTVMKCLIINPKKYMYIILILLSHTWWFFLIFLQFFWSKPSNKYIFLGKRLLSLYFNLWLATVSIFHWKCAG